MSSTPTTSVVAYIRWLTAQTPLLNSWPQNSGPCDIFLGCVILNNVNKWCAPQQVYHCSFAEWMAAPQQGRGHVCFCSQLYSTELKGLTLNRRFSLNAVCWKEGREGGRGGKKKSQEYPCLSNFGWSSRDRLAFLHQFPFPCWAHILTPFRSLLLAGWSKGTENERGYRLRWYMALPGLALKNFPQNFCPSSSFLMAVDQLPSVQRGTLRAWEIRSPRLEGA